MPQALPRPRALLLDAFGTLFDGRNRPQLAAAEIARLEGYPDAERLHAEWWRASAEEDWPNSPFRSIRSHLTTSLATAGERLGIRGDAARGAEVQIKLLREAPLLPGAREALERLRSRFRVALVTNADEEIIRPLLALHGLDFAHGQTSEASRAYKPSPRLYSDALAALGLAAGEALAVGDSWEEDVAGAAAAGLAAVWLNPEGRPSPEGGPPPAVEVASLGELCESLGA